MRCSWLAVTLCLYATLAAAQYKWIDNAGRVGFGDKPPPGAHDIEALDGYVKGTPVDALSELPYELQRAVKLFPVTLYTMDKCKGCDLGRALLKSRSVPFTERTIASGDDAQALKKLTGSDQLPAFQVGSRTMTGFSSAGWNEALDLAGYPHDVPLPARWSWPAPKPLTEPKPPEPAAPGGAAPADANKEQ
jgi:glutaredoxin